MLNDLIPSSSQKRSFSTRRVSRRTPSTRRTHRRTSSTPRRTRRVSRRTPRATLRLLAVLAVFASTAGLLAAPASPASSQESISEAREDLDRVKEEKLRLQARIDLIDAEDIDVLEALNAAQELVDRQEATVSAVRQELRTTTAQVRQKEISQQYAQMDIAAIREEVKELAVESYLRNEAQSVEALLGTEDITQGLRRLALLNIVQSNTNDLMDQVRLKEDEHSEAVLDISETLREVQQLEAELAAELTVLEAQRQEQLLIKVELDVRRRKLQREYANWDQEARRLGAFIRQEIYEEELRKQQEELRRRAQELGVLATAETAALGFIWPTAGHVTSGYGNRLHPILGIVRLHAGIDLGSALGQSIYASKSGVVIRAEWVGGYGNTVIIDHGAGFSSLYGHLHAYSVTTGDFVNAGQEVGKLGSTGLSTGPHLHFEIRVNGKAEDPLKYLS